jgi:hypothetical protein
MLPPTVDASELWGLMRGYPTLRQYVKAVSPEASQIVFLDGAGKTVQIIERCPGGMLPCSVTFPKEASQIYFSDYQQEQGIVYARRVALHGQDRQKGMEFHVKKMTFNEPIPEDIFKLQVMAGFEIISVSE